MEEQFITLVDLFDQLGLESEQAQIQAFIDAHKPIAKGLDIYEADFWSPSQVSFLKDELTEDSEWSLKIHQLDNLLRAK